MAENVWRGDAMAVAQVGTLTFAGTMTPGDYYDTIINRKFVRLEIDGTMGTPALAAAALAELIAEFEETEFREVTWNYTDGDAFLLPTAADPGKPHTITTAASGGAAGTLTYVQTVASEGPYHGDVAANWSLNVTPANTNDIVFPPDAGPCLYGIDFSTITPNSIRAYSKNIGLPDRTGSSDSGGYVEYRNKVLTFAACATVTVGDPDYDSPELCRIHLLSTAGTTFVNNCGGGVVTDPAGPPVRFTSAVSAGVGHDVYNLSGSIGLASGDGEGVKVRNFFNGTYNAIEDSAGAVDEVATAHIGRGAIMTAGTLNSGTVRSDVAVATVTIKAIGVWSQRVGMPTTLVVSPSGTFELRTSASGTITAATFTGGTFDLTGSVAAVTVTTLTALSESRVQDPHKRLKAGTTLNIIMDRSSLLVSDLGDTFTLGLTA